MSRASRIFVGITAVLIAALLGLLFVLREVPLAAATAFLGVLVGGAITGFVQYWISELDRSQQMRLAALDRRLEAHQEAYTLWRKLIFADKKSTELSRVVSECQDWWEANCVFLTPEAREAFLRAYLSASSHAQLLAIHAKADELRSEWQIVSRAGDVILRGVELPPISGLEESRVQGKEPESDA